MSVTHSLAFRIDTANLKSNQATTFSAGTLNKLVLYSGTAQSGTVAVTNGSPTVTGTGTSFTSLSAGQSVQFAGDTTHTVYTIASITSNTSLTLTANYGGSTLASSNYVSAPLNASASLSSNTAISTLTALVYGTPNSSTAVMSLSATADPNAVGGTAMFYRITKSDGVTCIEQGIIGTSGYDLNLSTMVIASGATVSLTSGSYTPVP